MINDRGGNDLKRVQFSRVRWNKDLEGKRLNDWVVMEGLEPTIGNGAELVIKAQLKGGLIVFSMPWMKTMSKPL